MRAYFPLEDLDLARLEVLACEPARREEAQPAEVEFEAVFGVVVAGYTPVPQVLVPVQEHSSPGPSRPVEKGRVRLAVLGKLRWWGGMTSNWPVDWAERPAGQNLRLVMLRPGQAAALWDAVAALSPPRAQRPPEPCIEVVEAAVAATDSNFAVADNAVDNIENRM